MAENAIDVLAREEEEQSKAPSAPLTPSYTTPTPADIEKSGGLHPITADQQAKGGKDWFGDLRTWKRMPASPERDLAREQWHQKYYGMSYEDYKGKNFLEQSLLQNRHQGFDPGSAIGQGALDFAFDVIGSIPGAEGVDDWWDEHTRYQDPLMEGAADLTSIVLPSMVGGAIAGNMVKGAPWLARAAGLAATDVAITGVSDVSERDETLTSMAVDAFPGIVGPKGWIPAPEALINTDDDSAAVRTKRNMLEAAGIPVVGNMLGFAFTRGGPLMKKAGMEFNKAYLGTEKRIMGWFNAKDETAKLFKSNEVAKVANPKKIQQLAQIDETIASGMVTKSEMPALLKQKEELLKDLDRWDGFEHYNNAAKNTIDRQSKSAAVAKIEANPNSIDFDPDITPNIAPDAANARQSIPAGNVARNQVDVAANSMGITKGDPTPIMPESVVRKVLKVGGKARDISLDIAKKGLEAGDFTSKVMGIRITKGMMSDEAFNLLSKYLNAPNGKELKKLFLNKGSVIDFGNNLKVSTLGETEKAAALQAYQILNDRYLGRPIAETSARLMNTLGAEVSTIAEAGTKFKGVADDQRIRKLIREKMEVLWPEYRLSQYLWGVQGNNLKGNINNLTKNPAQLVDIVKNLENAENAIHAKARNLSKTLEQLEKTNPEAMSPLSRAFEMSDGDVNTLVGLQEWSTKQLTPWGLIKSPDGNKLNTFASATWSYVYNNVLSGLSTFRAVIGNGKELGVKPLNAVLGHIAMIPATGFDFQGIKKMWYYYGAIQETNARALKYMWSTVQKVNKDPDAMMDVFRKDYSIAKREEWKVLDEMANIYRKEEDIGHLFQYDLAKGLDSWSRTRYARFAMTGMSAVDGYTTSYMATLHARMKAYDQVMTEHGKINGKLLKIAEEKHYKGMFNSQGLLNDAAVKNATGEVALNLDSQVAKVFNDATTHLPAIKPVLMFPRSGTNAVRLAMSYTPIASIPGMNKYSKTIWAQTDDQIAAALKEHGLSLDTPNARNIFENLRKEYIGRQVFSTLLVNRLWSYAMDGNIRGNGHYNGQRGVNERRELRYEPKTIKIGNKWVSYKGIPGVDQVLSILGDIAYYSRDLEQPIMEDWERKLMWTISASFLNETPLGGLEPLTAIATGDFTGANRLFGNTARSFVPFSGGAGVLQKSIDTAQHDLNKDITEYVKGRLPFASFNVAYARDIWTGEKINDLDNPWLARLNAFSPIKFSDAQEDWRVWLQDIGYRGTSKLLRDSSGKYEYSAEEREAVYELIGQQKPYKKLIRLMKSPKYQFQTGQMRAHRVTGDDLKYDKMEIDSQDLLVFDEIDHILKEAQQNAEVELMKKRPDIFKSVQLQRQKQSYIKQGRVDDARRVAESEPQKRQEEINNLLKMKK